MSGSTRPEYVSVTADDIAELPGLDDWRYVVGTLDATFRAGSYRDAAALVQAIVDAAEAADHHPSVDLRWPDRVHVRLTTHVTGDVTMHDVGLASVITSLAASQGAVSEPSSTQEVEVAIDTTDPERIRPFWRAVLGYEQRGTVLVDPRGVGPMFWFQTMTEPRTERSRFHIDVSVAHDEAAARIEAALAVGGRMVNDRFARSWWVLADADGNEACVCTWQDRNG